MSATSVAFEHYQEGVMLGNAHSMQRWSQRLPDYIRDDFPVPSYVQVRALGPVIMECTACDVSAFVSTSHMVGTFLDDHGQCDRARTVLWVCGCGGRELEQRYHCRACESSRPDHYVVVYSSDAFVPEHRAYELYRSWAGGSVHAATLSVGSLREAMRAARAMLPREEFRVVLGKAAWDQEHASK